MDEASEYTLPTHQIQYKKEYIYFNTYQHAHILLQRTLSNFQN
jgi:hypothetical protein